MIRKQSVSSLRVIIKLFLPFTMMDVDGRVLSIQSHVAFGYVGGKAAVFPLQCLGYDVDVINTVNFSNHSGYPRTGGSKSSPADLEDMFHRLEENELLSPKRLLTGYVPGAAGLSVVAKFAEKLKQEKPDLIYLLDPVMGDAGRMYVAPDVIPVYQSLLKSATIITPNWFEVEVLTGTSLKDLGSLRQALTTLHEKYGVPNVVISSIPLEPWLSAILPPNVLPSENSSHLLCIASSKSTSPAPEVQVQTVPLLPGYFSGVGDLFSALLLAHFHTGPGGLAHAASHALAKTHAILRRTHEHSMALPEEERQPTDDEKDKEEPRRKSRRMRGRELRLVHSLDVILGKLEEGREMVKLETFWENS
ncbi:Ribokinase-like protein [Flagelloscypha sp. PMI_526]|nr:Ribokinase-like protein [Flagelloscypha sp. PMI_526]